MYWLSSHIIPSLETIKILGDLDAFNKWMKEFHPGKDPKELFEGYRFSINCCLNSFVDGICGDEVLGIESDFLLDHAMAQVVPINHVANTSEKTIFLKNLRPQVKAIIRSKNYIELRKELDVFQEKIGTKFDQINQENIHLSKDIKIDAETARKLWLIDFAHTYLVQINNNGPTANMTHPFNPKWTSDEQLDRSFEGYKYAIQFLWNQLLGKDMFEKTHLIQMHLADSWRDYKYTVQEPNDGPVYDIFNQYFNIEEQTSFDSFFYRIQDEITNPLGDEYGFHIHTIDNYHEFASEGYDKSKLFGALLDSNNIQPSNERMDWSDKIRERLYWYSLEVIDTRKSDMHLGIPSFNTMLAGTVALHNSEESDFSKVLVAKFTHPLEQDGDKNNYSYGILVDSKGAAGHVSHGWIIYQDACGDHSGFSGSEHRFTEQFISKYQEDDKIELRELEIPLENFTEFTDVYTKSSQELNVRKLNENLSENLQDARSLLLELITFQLCVRYYSQQKKLPENQYEFQFNTDKKSVEGEKDIVVIGENEIFLIECKLNPQTCDWPDVFKKLDTKVKSYEGKNVLPQLWFWYEPHPKSKKLLDKTKIDGKPLKYLSLNNPKGQPELKGVALKKLKAIMEGETSSVPLKPHPIWESAVHGDSFENFKMSLLPQLFLKSVVPDDISKNVGTVRKLLAQSYFEYDFIDIGLTHAIFTLEKALKIRYKEIHQISTRKSFKKLIDWFFEENYFETYNSAIAHQLRMIRNGKVHDEVNTIGGIVFLSKVATPVMLINDLYENRDLRLKRKEQITKLQLRLNKTFQNGSILLYKRKKFIIDRFSVAFINNKLERPYLSLIAWPIYDPNVYLNEEYHHSIRPSMEFRLYNWRLNGSNFIAIDDQDKEVSIGIIEKSINKEKYEKWKQTCEAEKTLSSFNELGAARIVNDVFLKELNSLHQQE